MAENRKIAVLCNYELLPERVGGMDYFFWEFDRHCKVNGIQVDWFFPNTSLHGDYGNLTIIESKEKSIEKFFLDFFSTNQPNYSHILTHFMELCTPFFYKINKYSLAKVIAIDHNPRPLNGYPLQKKLEKRLKGFLFSRYIDLVVGVSDYTVAEIIKDFGIHLKRKTVTVYNGVIISDIKIRAERNESRPAFLVASHLRESKGIHDLITAVNLLPAEIKLEIRIDIYGDGPYRSQLELMIGQLNLQHCFNFKGSSSHLKELYANYDYMLQPTHMECFSLSILESLAANVPVITTNVGGNEEVVTDNENGYIFQVKDVEALRDIIEKLYLGEQKITNNTRELIESSFSLEKMVKNHFKLILE